MALAVYCSDLQADLKISTTPWVYILEKWGGGTGGEYGPWTLLEKDMIKTTRM
jgi:hypothetical protein